ncbi:flagellar hook-basal body complex protein FliE [Aestuariibacter sp. AA17]|uniref:Flagellar hook-basal body complex protein FliE n=1 Tax=Fluctibacter corallii TaxID=2984329 RepID=A0ABT3AAG8_9ALTE|nr:flagellar hook-basal body complex protein FliE [Aestuariibacter sp. AA17]MCV2885316.1 flagellar hook-basal body complex protein FliE [Aestuariibacter sp. AA17]
MEIQPINLIEQKAISALEQTTAPQPTFLSHIENGLQSVNQDLVTASDLVERYAQGEAIQTDELMIALEQAQLSLKLAVEVKNKLTAAYQELFRMQV